MGKEERVEEVLKLIKIIMHILHTYMCVSMSRICESGAPFSIPIQDL